MKIAIVTLVSDNYGNKLQNYAVEQLLSKYGEVETFRLEESYDNSELLKKSVASKLKPSYLQTVLKSRMLYKYDITNESRTILGNLIYCMKHKHELMESRKLRKASFQLFSEKHLHISQRTITHQNCNEKEWMDEYDYFVCGSDQIWNPSYATTTDLAFLSFAPKEKTIAIAPSFGVSSIPEIRENEFAEWLKHISKLSIREEQGQVLIRDLTGRDAVLLTDPTMALDVEQWKSIVSKPDKHLPTRFVLCYFLGRVKKEYKLYIDKQAKLQKAEIINLFDIENREYYVLNPSEMLYCIQNALHVYTDSFHGTVFSILFMRNFTVFDRNENGASMNSRLSTLMNLFELNQHKYSNNMNFNSNITQIEWDKINHILQKEKNKTRDYLASCFEDNINGE